MNPLVELITKAAGEFPDSVAVETPNRSITYRELYADASDAAELLRDRRANTVALEGERDESLIAFLLGTMMAQCALVLLDPSLPTARREQMMTTVDADVHVLLSSGDVDVRERKGVVPRAVGDYVFFTSGTTGRPKAISGRWSSVAHFVQWQTKAFGLGPGDRFAQLTGVSFDVFLRDVFAPLISGATVCIPPPSLGMHAGAVLPWLADARITVIHAVPSLASRWLSPHESGETVSSDLRVTFFAGEPLTATVVDRWRQVHSDTTVVNLYGPTETTLAKFFHVLEEQPSPGLLPVGAALPEASAKIVDEEIWIATPHGTNGYVAGDAAMDAAFVTDAEGVLWYRTGDIGRIDDGVLWVLGRVDLQVKINGNRIEPEGVAAVLSEHPAIGHAVVLPWRRADDTQSLAAYYTAADSKPSPGELVGWLGDRLPAAHIPSVFQAVGEIPTTANGKVDRGALPKPDSLMAERDAVAPQSDREAEILAEFRTVLEDEEVHMHSDFFAHGGTSLEAVELTVRLEALTHRTWLMSDVYRLRTPQAIAADVDHRALVDSSSIARLSTQPASTGLSPQQHRYREVYLPRVNRSWSNMVALFALPTGSDAAAVEAALSKVVARHDSLRAEFATCPDGELIQNFSPTVAIDLRVVNLSEEADPDAEIDRLRLTEANSIIDIASRPLFRATLIQHRGDQRTLLWNVHHMVSDGYSQRLVHSELTHILTGGAVSDLPQLPISYRDYIAWAQESAAAISDAQSEWWRQVYATAYERPLLPTREGVSDGAGGIAYQFPIPAELVARIDDLCRRIGATPFTVCLTALFDVGYEMYGSRDLVIGTPAAGRQRAELERMIGNFISLVGIRVGSSEGQGFAQRVSLVRDRTTAAMENQAFQYDQVMQLVGAQPDDDRFPLTTIFLSLLDVPEDPVDSPLHRELGFEVKFDLMGYLKRRNGRLWLEFQTRRELLSQEQLEHWGDQFLDVLSQGLRRFGGAG